MKSNPGIQLHHSFIAMVALSFIGMSLTYSIHAQNLVPNPSFEILTVCPPSELGMGGPLEAPPWVSVVGTADYCNACSDPMYRGVPTNFQGYQQPHTGSAYVGCYYRTANSNYREYIQAQLLQPLEAGVCYKIGYWMNNANESCGTNKVGALLSEFPEGNPLGLTPQVNWGGTFFTDTVEWIFIFDYYTAVGGEEYITIGNFYNDANCALTPSCVSPGAYGYYYIDDVLIEEVPVETFTIDLGGPVTVCDSFTIDPGNPDVVYHWSTGATGPTLTVYTTGTYGVTATYACTQEIAEIDVTILHPDQVEIGPPAQLICDGDSYEINLDPNDGDYEWQDGSTDPDYTITTAGIYHVTLDNGCSISSDTVEITVMEMPLSFSIGPDTLLCDGDEFTISLDPTLGDFSWQDGSDDPFYTIDNDGTYALTISNMCGEQTDEIEVMVVFPPDISLGPDSTILCDNDIIDYDFDPDMGDYFWQDGSSMSFYTISNPGMYSVTVSNICGVDESQIYVSYEDEPVVDLGPDLQACPGETFILDGGSSNGTYTWQDGSDNTVFTVTSSGTYSLTITNACGTDYDDVIINYGNSISAPDLGPDFSLCPGEDYLLNVSTPGANYLWNDQSTADTLLVNIAGTFSVQVYNDCFSFTDTVVVTLNNNPPIVQLPADFNLCTGQTSILDPGLSGVSFLWSDGSMLPQLMVSSPGLYALTVSNTCGSSEDTVLISAGDIAPSVQLGLDTSLCSGDSIILLPLFDHVDSWLWQDGSTGQQFIATAPGNVSVSVANSCGNAYDTLMIGLLPAVPPLDLAADTAICPGQSVTLSISIPNVNILWSDGSTGNDLVVSDSIRVYATISNSCGSNTDSLTVSLFPETPSLDLGPDQTICPGELVALSPGIPAVSYLWHDGSTNPDFQTTQGGVIYLTITNVCGSSSDTLVLTESTDGPQLELGPDVQACEGETITIKAGISGVQYVWQDGSTSDELITTQPGTYSLTVSNSCGTDKDSINIAFTSLPLPQDLGPDSTLCEGLTLLLTASTGSDFTITWQDQSTGNNFLVTGPGLYSIHASNACDETSDSVLVNFLDAPDLFYLGPDTTICAGQSIMLSSPSVLYDITWQDGTSMPDLLVQQSGKYWLQLSNECGITLDTMEVFVNANTPQVNLEPELFWCPGDEFILDAIQPYPSTYQWSTGATTSSINVNTPGLYTVDVKTTCFQTTDQSEVIPQDDCVEGPVFYIPNIFSPDGNVVNDEFTVFTDLPDNVISMEGSIFDRWGNLVFGSSDNPFTWRGKFNDDSMNPGVYVYVIHIKYVTITGEVEEVFSGDVTLVR